ncbi:MAG: hypothetical protein WC320_00895 [Candidatus Paceibacterota bacterium]|jgi:hypothetical protein
MRRTRNAWRVFWSKLQLLFAVIFIIFLITFIYWFLFISPYFQIKEISIDGYNPSLAIWIDLYLRQNNNRFVPFWAYAFCPKYLNNYKSFLNFYFSDLEETILEKFPKIEKIVISSGWKEGVLSLKIKQREIAFLWCLQKKSTSIIERENSLLEPEETNFLSKSEECYYLDKNGIIFEEAPKTQGSFLNKILITETQTRPLGTKVIAPEKLEKLNQAFVLSAKEESPISINYLEMKTENSQEVRLVANEGFDVFYNLNDDFSEILKIIAGMKEEQLKGSFSNLEYIDYRYPPKMYYKIR